MTLQTFDAVEKATLRFTGHVPSKKNLWKQRASGRGIYIGLETAAQITSLVTQARIQWGPRKALLHPELIVTFYIKSRRSDRDNKLTCLLDVLQEAGVIRQDNVAQFNGRLVVEPAVVARGEESTTVTLKWSANA